MTAHPCNPRTWEADAGGLPRVQGQPDTSKTLQPRQSPPSLPPHTHPTVGAVPASCSHHWPGRAVSRGETTEGLWLRVTLGPLSVISETDLKRVVSGEEEPASIPKDPITLQPHLPCDDLQGASVSPLWWPKANTMSVARIPSIGCGA